MLRHSPPRRWHRASAIYMFARDDMTSTSATIEVDDDGVWKTGPSSPRMGIRWDEIECVSVSKLDCIESVETIVALDFSYGEFFELAASTAGFDVALERICTHLPGVRHDWKQAMNDLRANDEPITLWDRAR